MGMNQPGPQDPSQGGQPSLPPQLLAMLAAQQQNDPNGQGPDQQDPQFNGDESEPARMYVLNMIVKLAQQGASQVPQDLSVPIITQSIAQLSTAYKNLVPQTSSQPNPAELQHKQDMHNAELQFKQDQHAQMLQHSAEKHQLDLQIFADKHLQQQADHLQQQAHSAEAHKQTLSNQQAIAKAKQNQAK